MRKLNGITINGEYLGNSVVINGMFRAICTISPVIMRDFVTIINKIDKLDDAVKIRNFNCGFDCIDIEFENTASKGIASLYFKLLNGEPELTNCKLVIDNQEYSTFQDKISLAQKNTSQMTNPSKPQVGEETERQKRIRELKERKLEQQKKLVEMKKQKLEELKKQKLEELKKQKLGESKNPEQNQKSTGLSPEELKERKRKELLEKKKHELLNKKREEAGLPPLPPPVTNSDVESAENTSVNDEVSDKSEVISEKPSVDKDNIQKTQSAGGIESSEGDNVQSGSADALVETSDVTENDSVQKTESLSVDESSETNTERESTENDAVSPDAILSEDDSNFDVSTDSLSETVANTDTFGDEYDNLTDEELAALEAELDSEMQNMSEDNFDFDSEQAMLDAELNKYMDSGSSQGVGSYTELAETISQGLIQGLSQGLSDGLCQGLSQIGQGLSEGLSQGLSEGFSNMFGSGLPGMPQSYNQDFSQIPDTSYQSAAPSQAAAPSDSYQQKMPDFSQIDDFNNYAAMSARDSYNYDENSNSDDLSDLYSDFYSEAAEQKILRQQQEQEQMYMSSETNNPDTQNTSEVDALKAELEALKAETAPRKDLMSLDEFLEKQKLLAEAKEKKRRQKFRIVGSRERVNASALDNGVFVAGNKVYKWGDTKVLDE